MLACPGNCFFPILWNWGGRGKGGSSQVNYTDPRVRGLLPLRSGCRIEKHHPTETDKWEIRWQLWYPLSQAELECKAKGGKVARASRTRTGKGSLNKVV